MIVAFSYTYISLSIECQLRHSYFVSGSLMKLSSVSVFSCQCSTQCSHNATAISVVYCLYYLCALFAIAKSKNNKNYPIIVRILIVLILSKS